MANDGKFVFQFGATLDPNSVPKANEVFKKMVHSDSASWNVAVTLDTAGFHQQIEGMKNEVKSVNQVYTEMTSRGINFANVSGTDEHLKAVKELETEYVNLRTKMYDISKGHAFEDGVQRSESRLNELGDKIQEVFKPDEIKQFESILGHISWNKTVSSEDVQNVEYLGDSIANSTERIVTFNGVGGTTVRVIQSLNEETGAWENTNIKSSDSVQYLQNQIKKLSNSIRQYKDKLGGSNEDTSSLDFMDSRLSNINIHANDAAESVQEIANEFDSFKTKMSGSGGALNQYIATINKVTEAKVALYREEIKGKEQDPSIISMYKEKINTLERTSDTLRDNIGLTDDKIKAEQALEEAEASEKRQKEVILQQYQKEHNFLYNIISGFKDATARVINYTVAYRALWKAVQLLRESVEIAEDLNAAFTDIQMVTLGTNDSINKLADSYAKLAVQMSSTVKDVAEGADTWLRQGKSAEETGKLLEASMVLAKVGAISASDATTYLTAALNGYKLSADDAMHVVDALSQADVESASSVSDLAIALEKSANTASMAGVSFETLVGYAAEIKEVTQKSAETVGESIKTIISRLGSVKAGTFLDEDLANEYDNLNTFINDTEKVLSKVGIRLRDTNQDFRDAEDVLDDVAAAWNTYTDLEKNAIATAIAGTRQRESFTALMSNYGKATTLATDAINSQGKALEKYDVYQQSVAASQDRIKAYWEEWVQNVDFQGLIKNLLKAAEVVMSIFSNNIIVNMGKVVAVSLSLLAIIKSFIATTKTLTLGKAGIIAFLTGGMGAVPTIAMIASLVVAITAIIAAIEHFHKSVSELKSDLSGTQAEIEQNASTIEEYKNQISETKDKVSQLESLSKNGGITLVQKEELDSLKETNRSLEHKIALLEQEDEIKKRSAQADAKALYKKSYVEGDEDLQAEMYTGTVVYTVRTIDEDVQNNISLIKNLKQELNSAVPGSDEYTKIQAQIDKINSTLIEEVKTSQDIMEPLEDTDPIKIALQNAINAYYDSISTLEQRLESFASSDANKSIINDLKEMANSGTLTEESLGNLVDSSFFSALSKANISVKALVQYLNSLASTAAESEDSLVNLQTSIQTSNQDYVDAYDKISLLIEAYKDLISGQSLTVEQMQLLIAAYPQLAQYIYEVSDGYKIEAKYLFNVGSEAIGMSKSQIKAQISATDVVIKQTEERIKAYQTELQAFRSAYGNINVREMTRSQYNEWNEIGGKLSAANTALVKLQTQKNKLSDILPYGTEENNSGSGASSTKDEETAYEKDVRILEHKVFLAGQWADKYKDVADKEEDYKKKVQEEADLYTSLMDRTHQEANIYREKGYDENSEEIQNLQEKYWGYYNDRKSLLDDYNDYVKDKLDEEEKSTEDALSNIKEAVQDLLDDAQDKLDKEKDAYDYRIKQLEAIRDLTSSYYDIMNQVNSEIDSINSELEISKSTYQYMDEELRKTIFNEDDYNALSEKLNQIAADSTSLYETYLDELSSLGEDEIYKADLITNEFERQYNYKKLEYEAAQKELDLVKAQTALQNTLANRNVRMYQNGQWVWTADRESVKSAQEAVADAEAEYKNAQISLKQQAVLDQYNAMIDSIQAQSDAAQAQYDALSEQWNDIEAQLTTEGDSMSKLLAAINDTSVPEFQKILDSVGDSLYSFISKLTGETISVNSTTGNVSVSNGNTISGTSSGVDSDSSDRLTSTDWSAVADKATNLDELQEALDRRSDKASVTGQDISGNGGIRSNAEIFAENAARLGYDHGGILNGLGGIKATNKDETIFDSDISSKLLNPQKSKEFLNSANAITQMLDNSSAINSFLSKISGIIGTNAVSNSDSHDTNISGGIKLSMQDSNNMASILRRYIPITG